MKKVMEYYVNFSIKYSPIKISELLDFSRSFKEKGQLNIKW